MSRFDTNNLTAATMVTISNDSYKLTLLYLSSMISSQPLWVLGKRLEPIPIDLIHTLEY